MTRLRTIPLALLCLLLVGAKGVPTTDEIRQMLDEKQYRRVLREVARAQALKGDDAAAYDKGQLLVLRGEAQLGLRVQPAAAKSFRDAAETASRDEDRATARALAMLLAKSEDLVYTPRTGGASGASDRGIDILADRKAALAALLADELAAIEPKAQDAKGAKSIADVLAAAKAAAPVGELELAVTGSRKRVDEMMNGFASQVAALLDQALIDLDRQADNIEQAALTMMAIPPEALGGRQDPKFVKAKKRGLAPGDQGALRSIMDTCREIVSRNRDVALELGADPDRFRSAGDFAIRLSAKARAILRADYSGIVDIPADRAPKPITGTRTEKSSPGVNGEPPAQP
jgi:hypothetical protein